MHAWANSADPSLSIEDFADDRAYAGADVAAKRDLTSWVRVFRRMQDDEEHFYVFGEHWLPEETAASERLCRERYQSDGWIYSSRVMRRWTGTAERRTPGGNLRVYADRTGGVLDSVLITGDYFSRSLEVAALESRLRGVPAQADAIRSVLAAHGCETIYRVEPEALSVLISEAATSTGPRLGPIAMRA